MLHDKCVTCDEMIAKDDPDAYAIPGARGLVVFQCLPCSDEGLEVTAPMLERLSTKPA